ncbi:peptidase M48 [bacterium (Candidatus Blackallbacteria) CG17_big_fil_post_rev_8_21_14_2_50_48_46]|uniref:Peptidase M48 n=1 Tax=bacterium (Candidatus Blackallbacteria) CG17_big_fil_post_rev_8_21_14_2_50_48_46 TaxID=2014261 RepID=A0A2M7FZH2_9BACT|nr:MAG: peptidase M48 [bacterium (Candidatus Blackallbacteria) CG18_big_fil_WC_8_21_14_2_50_49_26]PIW14797.1 MAG: peptidase M48 [bacterium (Candidatus Blackallbacteria) CG17_big_fil_post_rev_8_21_14_2_50_48_46]PIW50899.1 MAG: peptidase M48 [bacterium (Candidatus Blackallbacteria) CG13_big_fil_rev_8_21_14_2_50_49_14]
MSQTEADIPADAERKRLRCRYCHKNNAYWDNHDKAPNCRRCKLPLSEEPHLKWQFVDPDAYAHPLDRQALQALRQIPGIDMILKKLLALTVERMIRVACNANSLQVGPDQFPDLDAKLEVVCQTLNVRKPKLYVSVTDNFGGIAMNAETSGTEDPFIIIYAGLLERLSDEELLAVLAHEVGHIHCQHLLYRAAAITLLLITQGVLNAAGIGAILGTIGMPIQMALLMWSQKAELSCDRAALLVTQNPRVVMSALMKLAGGSLKGEANLDAFIKQAKEFERAYEEDFLDKFWTLMLASRSTHPFPVWRISEIIKWTEDLSPKSYQALLRSEKQILPPEP